MGRKLRDVRIELQVRLGFGSVDQPVLAPILNSFLAEAQEQLYKVGTFKALERYWDMTVAAGTANIAFPSDGGEVLNEEKITDVKVDIGNGSPYWNPVIEGIRPCDYNDTATGYPRRYERRSGEFEFVPERDVSYTVRVFGSRKLNQLRDDDDTFDIDDRLCFIVALSYAKQHYRHPDAKEYMGKASSIFAAVKWGNAGPKLVKAEDDPVAEPRPVVV